MKNKLKELIDLDLKRRKIRDDAKNKYYSATMATDKSQILFPPLHIEENMHQLRTVKSWFYNGFIIELPGLSMLVDPGVDITYRLTLGDYPITKINTLFISHSHLDHTAGANTLMDWLISKSIPTQIITEKNVVDSREISEYHSGIKNSTLGWKANHFTTIIEKNIPIQLVNGSYNLTPISLDHGIDCSGFILEAQQSKIGYISDTGYAKKVKIDDEEYIVGIDDLPLGDVHILEKNDYIKKAYSQVDILIVNVETFGYKKNSNTHLTIFDVIDIVKDSKVNTLILAHVNPMGELGEEWPQKLSEYIKANVKNINVVYPKKSGLSVNI